MSEDEGKTWPISRALEPGPSGYSDIAVGDDGRIYAVYEGGSVNSEGAFIPGNITFASFTLEWLMQGDR